jgi:hypothetical protein
MEDAAVNFKSRNPALAVVRFEDELGGSFNFFDIDLLEAYTTLAEEPLGAVAVRTPASRVHSNFWIHTSILPPGVREWRASQKVQSRESRVKSSLSAFRLLPFVACGLNARNSPFKSLLRFARLRFRT